MSTPMCKVSAEPDGALVHQLNGGLHEGFCAGCGCTVPGAVFDAVTMLKNTHAKFIINKS